MNDTLVVGNYIASTSIFVVLLMFLIMFHRKIRTRWSVFLILGGSIMILTRFFFLIYKIMEAGTDEIATSEYILGVFFLERLLFTAGFLLSVVAFGVIVTKLKIESS